MLKRITAFFPVMVLVMMMTLLAGCGGTSNNSSEKADSDGSYSVIDSQGTKVVFKKKPTRIVTTSIGNDTIVLGMVKTDRMAAVNSLLDDPVSSNIVELGKQVPNKIRKPSVEKIVSLQPDLVIAGDWGNLEYVQSLRDMGINVLIVKGVKNFNDIRDNIRMIAAAIGEKEKGDKLLKLMDDKLAEIKAKTDKIPQDKRKSAVLISLMSNYGGTDCIYDEACKYGGVINGISAAGLKRGDKLTKEMIVQIDPDILFLPNYTAHGKYDIEAFRARYLEDPSMQQMRAIKEGQIKFPRDCYIYSTSQDIVLGAQEIAYAVYGDEFKLEDQQHLSVADD